MPELTRQQELFCHEYLKDLNATQAAIRAGYSEKTAKSQGQRLLTNVDLESRIQELFTKRIQKVDISAERVLDECRRIALADVKDAFNDDGTLKDIHDIPEDIRRGISGFEVEELFEWQGEGENRTKVKTGELKKVKFWSKDKNVENLMKYFGMFGEDNKQKGEAEAEKIVALVERIRANRDTLPIYEPRFSRN